MSIDDPRLPIAGPRFRPALGTTIIALSAAALIATYLGWISITGSSIAGCGPDSGCEQVLRSRWSKWFGFPVSLIALPIYLAMLAGTCSLLRPQKSLPPERLWRGLILGSLLLVGAAVWFAAVQAFVLQHFCPWCLTAHGLGLAAGGLLIGVGSKYLRPRAESSAHSQSVTSGKHLSLLSLVAIALTGIGVLIAGQLVYRPAEFVVQPAPGALVTNSGVAQLSTPATNRAPNSVTDESHPRIAATSAISITTNQAQNPIASTSRAASSATTSISHPDGKRIFELYGGRFKFDLDDVPILGRADAPHFIVSLYDYSCKHCRAMHGILAEAQQAFSNELGIINLPMPLDPRCNRLVKQTHPDHIDACDYARIGLAVWHADRKKYEAYETWFFHIAPPAPPPTVAAARQFAGALIGDAAVEKMRSDPWVDARIQEDVDIYELSYNSGQGNMPQIVFGKRVAVGTLRREDVYRLLAETFGLGAMAAPVDRPVPLRP